jgi:hypothetical protein
VAAVAAAAHEERELLVAVRKVQELMERTSPGHLHLRLTLRRLKHEAGMAEQRRAAAERMLAAAQRLAASAAWDDGEDSTIVDAVPLTVPRERQR